MKNYERKNMIKLGLVLQLIGYMLIGLSYFVELENKTNFFLMGVLGRITSGVGTSQILISSYALVPLLFKKDEQPQILTQLEVYQGLSFTFGYSMAGALYSMGGYLAPFFFNYIFQIGMLAISFQILPSNLEIESFREAQSHLVELVNLKEQQLPELNTRRPITYKNYLQDYKSFLLILILLMVTFCVMGIAPVMSIFLKNEIHITDSTLGYIYQFSALSYLLGCSQIQRLQKFLTTTQIIALSPILNLIVYLFYGPSTIFDFR